MLSKVTVFHRGGAVLWSSSSSGVTSRGDGDSKKDSGAATNALIETVLANEKTGTGGDGANAMQWEGFTLKWSFANHLNLVFVAAYFSFQKLFYIEDMLETIKRHFVKEFDSFLLAASLKEMASTERYSHFDETYVRITHAFVAQFKDVTSAPKTWKQKTKGRQPSQFQVKKGDSVAVKKRGTEDGAILVKKTTEETDSVKREQASATGSGVKSGKSMTDLLLKQRVKSSRGPRAFGAKARGGGKRKAGKRGSTGGKATADAPKKKEARDWGAWSKKGKSLSKDEITKFSMCDEDHDVDQWAIDDTTGVVDLVDSDTDDSFDDEITLYRADGSVVDSEEGGAKTTTTSLGGSLWSRFSKLVSDSALTEEDLAPALEQLTLQLTGKNVTSEVSQQICQSVGRSLVGKQIGTLTTVRSALKDAMTLALERILTPVRPVNVLHGIEEARSEQRPFSIAFIGVNGVGKSTSLSKVIWYLKKRGLKVSVAACDTFRSGAVEQLKTHCKAHRVRLFQQGYAKDPSAVASSAIREATRLRDDVVLIDTAGRMQNNEGLMRALTALISRNTPDLILFVGEALVGNDGVDQLLEFDRALRRFSTAKKPRTVDGIILTKFDAVDDKLGAAISMVYHSAKPIVFVGVGQNYEDLRRMNVATFVSQLLK